MSQDLEQVKAAAKAVHSDYLRRLAQLEEQKLADLFWKDLEQDLSEDQFGMLLTLFKDLSDRVHQTLTQDEKDDRIRELELDLAQAREKIHKLGEELRSR